MAKINVFVHTQADVGYDISSLDIRPGSLKMWKVPVLTKQQKFPR